MIMISSYTANLAASLTLSRMAPAISNVEDLAKQTTIQYGCKGTGSTHAFFKDSNHTTYQRMYNTMESNREVYINDINDAIERIRKGGYAYLAESSTIEYLIQRHCDLIQVGFWLDNKGYGIATPNDSPYRTPISNAIVVLQDKGVLYALKKRWWEEKGKCKIVSNAKAAVANDLKIENVGGVFVVLVAGVVLGCLLGALEFIWKSLKIARDERVCFMTNLMCFQLNCLVFFCFHFRRSLSESSFGWRSFEFVLVVAPLGQYSRHSPHPTTSTAPRMVPTTGH